MAIWTLRDVMTVDQLRRAGHPLSAIQHGGFPERDPREVQEAWWATINRPPTLALERLERTLRRQAMGEQNINMRPAYADQKNGALSIR